MRVVGLADEGGVPAGHVSTALGSLRGGRLSGGQREGPRHRQPSQTVAQGGDAGHQRAAEDTGHQQQSTGELLTSDLKTDAVHLSLEVMMPSHETGD